MRPAALARQRICASAELESSGRGRRFEVELGGRAVAGFVVRYGGRVYGYINQCAHMELELDWNPGMFFDTDGRYLLCATHDALYEPRSGACVAGPCGGGALTPLDVCERDGDVILRRGRLVGSAPERSGDTAGDEV